MAGQKKVRRIGILTGGGDCPGLNAVIRIVTKAAINHLGIEVIGIEDGFLGLIRNRMHQLDTKAVSNILTLGGTILGTSNKANPSHFAVRNDDEGNPVYEDVTPRILEHLEERRIDALVCIGGDGTMSGAANLVAAGIPCIGVPKTIDNDLMHTDITFGFTTAVQTATECLDKIHSTAFSHHRVMIVELMGRNAGWLTMHAGIASGSDVILIPEIPFEIGSIVETCQARARRQKKFTLIAVSEGAKQKGGDQVVAQIVKDSPDPIRLGGVSQVLANQLAEHLRLEVRATILGHIQRGGTPCAFDRVLASQFGYQAVRMIEKDAWNRMAVMQKAEVRDAPIAEVANQQRVIRADDPLLAMARAVDTCLGD